MLARSALRTLPTLRAAAAPAVAPRVAPVASRGVTTLAKQLYTAHARATGQGRNGHAGLVGDEVGLEVKLG